MAYKPAQTLPNLAEPHQRLEWARARANLADATEAARRHNWNENTYRSHENGNRPLSREAAVRYSKAFKVPAGWLLFNERAGEGSLDPRFAEVVEQIVPDQVPAALRVLKAFVNAA